MIHRRRRLAARFLAIGLLTAPLFTVHSLASPSPAEARCAGLNNPLRSTFSYAGAVRASETAGFDTCNGNNYYTGFLKDERADGYCVSVWFMEAGFPWIQAGDTVCGNGNTSSFVWQDINGNSRAYEQLCIETATLPRDIVACGWGNGTGYGTNYGY